MIWLIVGIVAVLVLPVLAASLTVCAPKWWEQRAPGRVKDVVRWIGSDSHGEPRWIVWLAIVPQYTFGVLLILVLTPLIVLGTLVHLYTIACMAVIEGACPYTKEERWRSYLEREWDDAKHFLTKPRTIAEILEP